MSNVNIAVITPKKKEDYLANTILDGLIQLRKRKEGFNFFISSTFNSRLDIESFILPEKEFINFAKEADIILLIWGKKETDYKLAKKINQWNKTIFIDGSEAGLNNRYDFTIQKKILEGKYKELGKVNSKMLKKCALYFRREKPYINGIIPLPYGIESGYIRHKPGLKKDIDFVCIFGQDEYPLMRRYVRELLVKYCQKNNFSYRVKKTKTPDEFYKLLARAKVGISVGGGGYDTARFWEILGNNCLLLTERIDIFQPDSKKLDYKRIWEFNNLYDFWYQLEKIGKFLRKGYNQDSLMEEYQDILENHSAKARVLTVLNKAKEKGLIN